MVESFPNELCSFPKATVNLQMSRYYNSAVNGDSEGSSQKSRGQKPSLTSTQTLEIHSSFLTKQDPDKHAKIVPEEIGESRIRRLQKNHPAGKTYLSYCWL